MNNQIQTSEPNKFKRAGRMIDTAVFDQFQDFDTGCNIDWREISDILNSTNTHISILNPFTPGRTYYTPLGLL